MSSRTLVSLTILLAALNVSTIRAQSTPRFEMASIKPCKAGDMPTGGGRSAGGTASGNDPGRLSLQCQTLDRLIRTAYLRFGDGKDWYPGKPGATPKQMNQPISGEPAWVNSDRFNIDAKPESPQAAGKMRGPMLQTLLEDRFRLKIRRDVREVPVYALVVGKGGGRLAATRRESCISVDFTKDPPPLPGPDEPPFCGFFRPDRSGGTETLGQTLAGLCRQFSVALDRDVVDRTGIAGTFDIHLELSGDDIFPFARRDSVGDPAASAVPADPLAAIMAAVQKLGLKLESAKAPSDFLVIDHVERPSAN